MTLCGLILAWGVWASDCILHDAFVPWKDKRKDADASALMYCWMLLFWTNPSDSGPGVCDSRMPFIFSCVYVAVLTGLIIYKMRKRKSAGVEAVGDVGHFQHSRVLEGPQVLLVDLRLRAARAAKGLSQQALADLVGASRQTINAIEQGDYNPTINLCIAICRALDRTLDDLFWEGE